jgi:hypothetical protein
MNLRLINFILILVIGLTSCSSVIQGLYGIKKPKELNDQEIIQYSKKYNIPLTENYKLDTAYLTFLSSLDTTKFKEQIKNHYQPLQVLYYNKTGRLESFQINCYAGGFPNLDWNRDSIFTTFPPREQAPIDSIVSRDLQLKYMNPISQTTDFSNENFEYIVIVYWNRLMGRQSKRLIHFVQENSKLARGYKVKIIYVNTDNIFALTDIEKK